MLHMPYDGFEPHLHDAYALWWVWILHGIGSAPWIGNLKGGFMESHLEIKLAQFSIYTVVDGAIKAIWFLLDKPLISIL